MGLLGRAGWGRAALAAAALLLAAAAPAGDFPAARDLSTVKAFLGARARLPAARIAALTAASAFELRPAPPGAEPRASVRQEILDPEAARRLGGRSAALTLRLDCAGGSARVETATVYAGRALAGAAHPLDPALWSGADPDADLADLLPAACRGRPARAAPAVVRVQIGAFRAPAGAREALAALQRRWPGESAGLELTLEPAGRGLVRALLGPFPGAAEAAAFCARLTAAGAPCLLR